MSHFGLILTLFRLPFSLTSNVFSLVSNTSWLRSFIFAMFDHASAERMNVYRYTVLAPKRLECVRFQLFVIFLVILHAMDKLNIPQ